MGDACALPTHPPPPRGRASPRRGRCWRPRLRGTRGASAAPPRRAKLRRPPALRSLGAWGPGVGCPCEVPWGGWKIQLGTGLQLGKSSDSSHFLRFGGVILVCSGFFRMPRPSNETCVTTELPRATSSKNSWSSKQQLSGGLRLSIGLFFDHFSWHRGFVRCASAQQLGTEFS